MTIKETKQKLLSMCDLPSLSHLGTTEQLATYIKAEFRELDLSKQWETLPVIAPEHIRAKNPYNTLVYYLIGSHEIPTALDHKYTGGDFPDIDMDFEPESRERLKQMLRDRFGKRNCLEVSTFGGLHTKSAIQDLSRIEGIDPQEVNKVTTGIKYNVNNEEENKLEWIMEHNKSARDYLNNHPKVYDWVEKMQEVKRSVGKHASAFIIANRPIDEYIPVIMGKGKQMLTGYPESAAVKSLNEMGLIKFDLLGLENLTVIRDCLGLIKQNHNIDVDLESINLEDPEVYKLLRKGYNGGIFQCDSPLAGMIISTIQPTRFEDILALNALIRPSCLQVKSHEFYRDHKAGKFDREVFPVWLDLKGKISDFTFNMLDASYGIPVYQEQIMAMLAEFCGVHLDETNKMRKIIGIPSAKKTKEHLEYIQTQQDKWMKFGADKFGEKLAWQWWETAVGSLSYGFNRSHSCAYSIIAYRQLWLKAKYPYEFYSALLKQTSAETENLGRNKLMKYSIEAKHLGVGIESPHVNISKKRLGRVNNKIYIGFEQIKGIGEAAAVDIVKRAPYTSFEDFIDKHFKGAINPKNNKPFGKSGVSKTSIESLIYTDAFRDYGAREDLLYKFWHSRLTKKQQNDPWHLIEIPSHFEILKSERDALTIVLSEDNPIKLPYGFMSITKALDTGKDRNCKIKGIVEKISWLVAKSGNPYARLIINDLENSAIVLCWKQHHAKLKTLEMGSIVNLEIKHLDGETFSLSGISKIETLTEQKEKEK
jgi:DNA polymerase-3 subunit alpha